VPTEEPSQFLSIAFGRTLSRPFLSSCQHWASGATVSQLDGEAGAELEFYSHQGIRENGRGGKMEADITASVHERLETMLAGKGPRVRCPPFSTWLVYCMIRGRHHCRRNPAARE
jgi:hypothetical protein